MNQKPHDKWNDWTTQEIQRYLKKYGKGSIVPGRCSNHRRKKIKYLQHLLAKREKAERLILGL
jgi:hypothetical protein